MSEQINSQPLGVEGKAPKLSVYLNVLEEVHKIIGDAGYVADIEWDSNGKLDVIMIHLTQSIGAIRIYRLMNLGSITYLSPKLDVKTNKPIVRIALDFKAKVKKL